MSDVDTTRRTPAGGGIRRGLIGAGAGTLLAACNAAPGVGATAADTTATTSSTAASRSDDLPIAAPARDGNIAIREEFDAAAQKNSVGAWTLFLARHPDHPLAAHARVRLDALN